MDLEKVAYVFESELEGTLSADAYAGLTNATRAWQNTWTADELPSLRFWSSPSHLAVEDRRTPASPLSYPFEEPVASIYLACSDRPRTAAGARETARLDLSERDVGEALLELEACGLVMQDGDRFVSLAVPATPGR